jgi:hypothetical protein
VAQPYDQGFVGEMTCGARIKYSVVLDLMQQFGSQIELTVT